MLLDEPIDLERDDFGHRSYASVLVELLSEADQPLTVGLLGPWGVGKSSILTRVEADLLAAGCSVVVFDAWRYDSAALRRQLVRDVAHELRDQDALSKDFDLERRMAQLEADQMVPRLHTRPSLSGAGIALAQTVVAVVVVLLALRLTSLRDVLGNDTDTNTALVAGTLGVITLFVGLVTQFIRTTSYVETQRRIEDPERFHELFRDVVAATTTRRLVIAIDNLDRCRAEEAIELLATIKTYLEPAAKQARKAPTPNTDVIFVIAVDDQALRRHLQASNDIAEDADEYLRKIFTATVPIAPLLDDDIRTYVSSRLTTIEESLAVDEATQRSLVALLDASYRDSPRQVLQFLNNLQLRLRLVRERERGGSPDISGTISENVLMIAKLALIEERWPDHYAQLVARPHLLEEFHRRATDPGFEPDELEGEWARFAPFLRLSVAIRADDLRPFLRLKQSADELRLPEFGRFRAAALRSDRAEVAAVLAAHPDQAADYARRARQLFRDELKALNIEAARGVLDITLTELREAAGSGAGAELLREAVDAPMFRYQLQFLPAYPLLELAKELSPALQGLVLDAVIEQLSDNARERSLEAASALAVIRLPGSQAAIRGAIDEDHRVLGRARELAVLAEADLGLLTAERVSNVLTRVTRLPTTLHDPEDGPALRSVLRSIWKTLGPGTREQEFLDQLRRALVEIAGSLTGEWGAELIEDVFTLAPDEPREAAADQLASAILSRSDVPRPLLEAVWLRVHGDTLRRLTALLLPTDHGYEFVASQLESADAATRDAAGRALADWIPWTAEPRAIELLKEIARPATLTAVAARWATEGATAPLVSMLLEHARPDETGAEQVSDAVLDRADQCGVDDGTVLDWLLLAERLDGSPARGRDVAASHLPALLAGSHLDLDRFEMAVGYASRLEDRELLDTLIGNALDVRPDRFGRVLEIAGEVGGNLSQGVLVLLRDAAIETAGDGPYDALARGLKSLAYPMSDGEVDVLAQSLLNRARVQEQPDRQADLLQLLLDLVEDAPKLLVLFLLDPTKEHPPSGFLERERQDIAKAADAADVTEELDLLRAAPWNADDWSAVKGSRAARLLLVSGYVETGDGGAYASQRGLAVLEAAR